MPEPKFQIGDYVYASDQPDCGYGTVIHIAPFGRTWNYRIRVPTNEHLNVWWYEDYLQLMYRPQATDAGAEEYEMVIAAQELLK